MNYLHETSLYDSAFGQGVLTNTATTHLAACPVCRQTVNELRILAHELAVARRSTLTATQLARYAALYTQQ